MNRRINDSFGTRMPVRILSHISRHLCRRTLDGTASAAWDDSATYGAPGMTPSIESFAALVPCDLLDRSGEVFYSSRAAFSSPSDVYLLSWSA